MNLCHRLTLSFRRRKRAASNAPWTENEKQTLVRKDDALNPPQPTKVPRHKAGQSSNTANSKSHKFDNASWPDDAQSELSETPRLLGGIADNSPSRREWPRGRQDKIENEYLDKLMLMVGLENAKTHFFSIYASVQAAKRRNEDPHEVVLDTVIVGNPGTGKKTVARLYTDFLMSLELVPKAEPLQTSGPQLRSENRLQEVLKSIQEMGSKDGGIVLVEEAHSIPDRRSVLEKLLGESAKSPSKIVLIVSSQGDDISDFTPGPHVNFRAPHIIKLPDYTDEELQKILVAMIHEKYDEPDKDIEGALMAPTCKPSSASLVAAGKPRISEI